MKLNILPSILSSLRGEDSFVPGSGVGSDIFSVSSVEEESSAKRDIVSGLVYCVEDDSSTKPDVLYGSVTCVVEVFGEMAKITVIQSKKLPSEIHQ